jgi:L-asparaginase
MSKPRIHILALGGTIATTRDASGTMQMGLGADDLVAAVPALGDLADIQAETVSKVGSHSLTFDQIHALAGKIRGLSTADAVVVTQGTDTLEETSFLLDLLLDLPVPVIVTAAMRNPALTSPDGPGNLLAAVRVACEPWVRANAQKLGVLAVMLDEVFAAADVAKIHPTRLNAFASVQTGPLAALVEDRIVPLALPVRTPVEQARKALGGMTGKGRPVALFWLGLDEPGRLVEAMLAAPDQLGYGGAVLGALGGGHVPEGTAPLFERLAQAMPTVVSPRAGGGGPLLRKTYGGPSAEIALQAAGLIWGGRLSPVKARVLLDTCLRAALTRATIAPVFAAFG